MLSLRGCLRRGALVVAGFVLSTAAPASAGQLYRWTTSDGTVAYSDDAKRVPVAYRARAARTTGSSARTAATRASGTSDSGRPAPGAS